MTFYFNQYQGNKPDVGAEVMLFSGKMERIPESYFATMAGKEILAKAPNAEQFQKYQALKDTIVDGSGNYELSSIQPGVYTVVILSKNHKRTNQRDCIGSFMWLDATVESGKTTDVSWDFGMSET